MDKIPLTELMKGPYSLHRCVNQPIYYGSFNYLQKIRENRLI